MESLLVLITVVVLATGYHVFSDHTGKNDTSSPDSAHSLLLRAAERNEGELTLASAAQLTGLSIDDVETGLEELVDRGVAVPDVTPDGAHLYRFVGLSQLSVPSETPDDIPEPMEQSGIEICLSGGTIRRVKGMNLYISCDKSKNTAKVGQARGREAPSSENPFQCAVLEVNLKGVKTVRFDTSEADWIREIRGSEVRTWRNG